MTPLRSPAYTSRETDAGFRYPYPDFGVLQAIGDSAAETFANSTLGGSAMQAMQYRLADLLSNQERLAPITKDEFSRRYGHVGERLKWSEGMSHARAELMYENLGDTVSRENRGLGGEHGVANVVGGLVGSFHPVDLLFGSLANKMMVFNRGVSTTEKLARQLSVPRAIHESLVSGLLENIVQEGAVAATADYRQYPYTFEDFVLGVGAGTIFSTGVGTVRALAANVSPGVARAMAAASVDSVLHGERTSPDAAKAASLDPRVHEAARANAQTEEALRKPGKITDEEYDAAMDRMAGDDGGNETVRLYRVEPKAEESPRNHSSPGWVLDGEAVHNTNQAAGRWFGESLEEVQWYLKNEYPDGRIVYVDVPLRDVEKYRVSNIPEKPGGKDVPENPRAFSRRPEKEFFLPEDLVERRMPHTDYSDSPEAKAGKAAASRVDISDRLNQANEGLVSRTGKQPEASPDPNVARATAEQKAKADYRPTKQQKLTLKTATQRSRVATVGSNEDILASTFKSIFGVDVRFYDESERAFFGSYGVTTAHSPKTLFVETGGLNKMLYVAGHELAHSLRFRDIGAWNSVVKAIANAGDGSLRKAYLEARTVQGNSRVWKSYNNAKRFDESMANVLGQAMQSEAFWNSLRASDKTAFDKMVSFLRHTAQKLGDVLRRVSSPETKELYGQIVGILSKVDPKNEVSDAVWLNEKARASKLKEIYAPYAERFEKMVGEEAVKARERAMQVDQFEDLLNELAPEHGTLQDRSLEMTAVERKQRLKYLNPQSFAIGVLLPKYYKKFWEMMQQAKTPEEKARVREAIRNSGAMFSYKLNDDGSYDFFIHRNDDFAKWRENRDPLVDDTLESAVAREYADEHLSHGRESDETIYEAMRSMFRHLAYGYDEMGKKITAEVEARNIEDGFVTVEKNRLYVGHLRDFLTSDRSGEAFQSKRFEDFLGGYLDFINERLDEYRLAHDEANYTNLYDRAREIVNFLGKSEKKFDPETQQKVGQVVIVLEGGKEVRGDVKESAESKKVNSDQFAATLQAEAKQAFEAFRKAQQLSDDRLAQQDYGNPILYYGDHIDAGTPAAIAEFREAVQADIRAELAFHRELMTTIIGDREGDINRWISDNIEKLTDERMRAIITNYDKIPKNERAARDVLKGAMTLDQRVEVNDRNFENSDENFLDTPQHETWNDEQIMDQMAVRTDEDFPEHARRTGDNLVQQQQRRMISAIDAARQAQSRIEAEAQANSAWQRDISGAVKAASEQKITEAGLGGVLKATEARDSLVGTGATPKDQEAATSELNMHLRQLDDRQQKLYKTIIGIRANTKNRHLALNNLVENEGFGFDLKNKYVARLMSSELDDIKSLWEYHSRNSATGAKDAHASLETLADNAIYKALLTQSKIKSLGALFAQGVKTVYSKLDGLARKGVKAAGASVSADQKVQISHDTAGLLNLLETKNLGEAWQQNLLTKALVLELKGVKSGDDGIAAVAKILKATHDAQMGRMNSFGANIRYLDDYAFSTVHDRHRIVKTGFEKWAADMMQWMDWDRTSRIVGTDNQEGYLKAVWEDIEQGRLRLVDAPDPELAGGNIASAVSRRRNIQFKEGYAFEYDMKYGSGDTASLILSQIIRRSEQSVIMSHFGPDYKATWNQAMVDSNFLKNQDWKASAEIRRLQWTFDKITGDIDHPVNSKIAAWGQAIRSYVNLVAGWTSTISSVQDLAGATATLRFMGMTGTDVEKSVLSALKEAHSREGSQSAWLRGQGAGLQAFLGSFARITGSDAGLSGHFRKINDLVFKYNGMNWWSRIVQEAYMDVATQHLGSMINQSVLTPELKNWLSHYNISEVEFRGMLLHAQRIEGMGGPRLSPDMVKNPDLAHKLAVALDDSMRYALLEPSASDLAILHLGTKAGTVEGEAIRTILQYKSFPLSLLRKLNRRFMNAYGEGGAPRAIKEKMAMFASMMFLGWIALSIKDVLNGREPMHFLSGDQWNTQNLTRLVSQAGTLGLFEDLFHLNESRQVSALVGPAGGMAYNLVRQPFTEGDGRAYRTTNAIFGAAPFASVPFVSEARKALLGGVFSDTIGTWDQATRKRRHTITGQGDIFLDSAAINN